MPPTRSREPHAEEGLRPKKHRIKVLVDHVQPSAHPVSSSTRTFSVRRLASGRKGQKRTQLSSVHHEQAAPITDGTARQPDVEVDELNLDANDLGPTPRTPDADMYLDLDEASTAPVNSDVEDISGYDPVHRTRRRRIVHRILILQVVLHSLILLPQRRKVLVHSDLDDANEHSAHPVQRGKRAAVRPIQCRTVFLTNFCSAKNGDLAFPSGHFSRRASPP
jgi:hypothetical protein